MNQTVSLRLFIDEYTAQVEPLYRTINEAYWKFTTTSDEVAEKEYTRLVTEVRALHADRERFEQLKQLSASADSGVVLARQAALALNAFQANQMPREMIEQITVLETDI